MGSWRLITCIRWWRVPKDWRRKELPSYYWYWKFCYRSSRESIRLLKGKMACSCPKVKLYRRWQFLPSYATMRLNSKSPRPNSTVNFRTNFRASSRTIPSSSWGSQMSICHSRKSNERLQWKSLRRWRYTFETFVSSIRFRKRNYQLRCK